MEVQTKSSSDSNITLCHLISPLIITFTDHEPTTNVCLKQPLFNTIIIWKLCCIELKAVSHSNPFHCPVNRDSSHSFIELKTLQSYRGSVFSVYYYSCQKLPGLCRLLSILTILACLL